MIVKKINKTVVAIQIAFIIIIFSVIGYILYSNFSKNVDLKNAVNQNTQAPEENIKIKYKNLDKIDLSILEEKRIVDWKKLSERKLKLDEVGNDNPWGSPADE